MNGALMFTDHADKSAKLNRKSPRRWYEIGLPVVAATLLVILLVATHFAIQAANQRAITAAILRLTEQSIKLAEETCEMQEISGIRVRFCVKAVGR